jgi:hypothetical protein
MPDDPGRSAPVRLTSRFNRVVAVLAWAAAAAFVAGIAATGRWGDYVNLAPLLVYAAAASYYLLWRPSLTVSDGGIDVVNVASSVHVPWEALVDVDTKYALALRVPGRSISVWCAPAPGAVGMIRASRAERSQAHAATRETVVRPGDLPATESGRAAAVVRERWFARRDAGLIEPGRADETPVLVTRDAVALAVLVGGAVVALVCLAVL